MLVWSTTIPGAKIISPESKKGEKKRDNKNKN